MNRRRDGSSGRGEAIEKNQGNRELVWLCGIDRALQVINGHDELLWLESAETNRWRP